MSESKQRLTPEQVFTPSRAPLKDTNVYVERIDAEAELRSSLAQGATPIIFGEFGVGKTSLALWHFREEKGEGRLVHYTNPENKSFSDVYEQVLDQLGYTVESSQERSSKSGVGGEIESGFLSVFKAKLSASDESGSTTVSELVVKSPTDVGMLRLMQERRLVLLVDELHRASREFRNELARLIKSLSDRGEDYPRLVIAGTSAQPEQLVALDRGVDRLVREVPVRPLTPAESRKVAQKGFNKLELGASEDVLDRIMSTAAGAPSLLHAICLESASSAIRADRAAVEHSDIDAAIDRVVNRHYHRLTERYMKATNTMGSKRYRGKILQACAESDSDFITMEMLVEKVSEYVGESVSRTRLSDPLRQLKSPEYGEILSDVERSDGEGRHYNLTVFSDPQMKAYVRFLLGVDARGELKGERN